MEASVELLGAGKAKMSAQPRSQRSCRGSALLTSRAVDGDEARREANSSPLRSPRYLIGLPFPSCSVYAIVQTQHSAVPSVMLSRLKIRQLAASHRNTATRHSSHTRPHPTAPRPPDPSADRSREPCRCRIGQRCLCSARCAADSARPWSLVPARSLERATQRSDRRGVGRGRRRGQQISLSDLVRISPADSTPVPISPLLSPHLSLLTSP